MKKKTKSLDIISAMNEIDKIDKKKKLSMINKAFVLNQEYKEDDKKKSKRNSIEKLEQQYYSLLEKEIKLKNDILKQNEKEIKSLNNENDLLNKKTLEIQKSKKQLLKDNAKLAIDYEKIFTELSGYKNDEHLEAQSEFIYKQQSLVKQYEEEITKLQKLKHESDAKLVVLQEENENLHNKAKETRDKEIASIKLSERENYKLMNQAINDANEKIKYYREDNLRLGNEVFHQSKKLENNTKQLEEFENNKFKIKEEINNLNNIISKNNVVKDQFNNIFQNDSNNIKKTNLKGQDLIDINAKTKDIFNK